MNKASLTVLISFSMLAGAAFAQQGGVAVSTDPAKAAEVEQRAQALQAQQAQQEMQPQPTAPMMHHKPAHHHKKAMKPEGGASPSAPQGASQ
ncbi:MAG TPA: hypothetical protein VNZ04_08910 [Trinickia sp.]|jgi:hypothetical protein|nr:hypothetical protein [Trinickia sp.]